MPTHVIHRSTRKERLRHCASEILLAACGALGILVFLFIFYDGANSIQWPLPARHIAVGTIPQILLVLTWRNYISYRLLPDPSLLHNRHQDQRNFFQQLIPWAYRVSRIIAGLAMFFMPIQFMFEDAQLNPETGDPFLFSVMCAICYAFAGILIAINVLADIVIYLGRKFILVATRIPRLQTMIWQLIRRFALFRTPFTFLVTAKIVLQGALIATEDPIVTLITVPIQNLPQSLENFRIIQLSDMHVGVSVGRTRMEKTIQLANNLCETKKSDKKCDLLALTGDLIDGDPNHLMKAIEPLHRLGPSNYKVPKIFVTGNHEHLHYNVDKVIRVLKEMGIDSLMNDNIRLPKKKSRNDQLVLVGLDDLSSKESRGEEQKAFFNTMPGKDIIVLLAHQPNHLSQAELYGSDLMISGHTHAGQMMPFHIGAWIWNTKYSGYYPSTKTAVYVSAGTHWWGPPVRFTTRHHEITDIRLTRSDGIKS